jgi:hypothetical protein
VIYTHKNVVSGTSIKSHRTLTRTNTFTINISLGRLVAPIDDSFLYSLFGGNLSTYKGVTWPFFKVNPNTLDDIFAVKVDSTWETDQLLVNCNVGCYVTRPLSADGVPY